MPNQLQLKSAFEMAFEKLPLLMKNRKTKEIRAFAARCIQTMMLGKKVKEVPYPEDDVCFTFQEVKDFQDILPMKLPGFESYIQWHHMLFSNCGLETYLSKLISELISTNADAEYKKILDKDPEILENVLKTIVISKNPRKIKEALLKLTDKIINVDDELLKNARIQYFQDQQKSLLNTFKADFPRTRFIQLQDKLFDFQKGDKRIEFLEKLRDANYRYLANNKQINHIIETDFKHLDDIGLPKDFSEENFKKLLPVAIADTVLNHAKYTNQQLTELENLTGRTKDEIAKWQRIKLLQFFVSFNQSTQAIFPHFFTKRHFNEDFYFKLVNLQSYATVKGANGHCNWTVYPSLNRLDVAMKFSLYLFEFEIEHVLDINPDLASSDGYRNRCIYATLDSDINIQSFVPYDDIDTDKGHAMCTNYKNLNVSPDAVNYLDKIAKVFEVKKT